jgi:hypothetical protein
MICKSGDYVEPKSMFWPVLLSAKVHLETMDIGASGVTQHPELDPLIEWLGWHVLFVGQSTHLAIMASTTSESVTVSTFLGRLLTG